jgi:hypothetical protein
LILFGGIEMGLLGYSFADLQRESGVTHWTWRRAAKDGLIRTINIGSRILIPLDEVERIKLHGIGKRRAQCESEAQ